jgi:hypothetical protein
MTPIPRLRVGLPCRFSAKNFPDSLLLPEWAILEGQHGTLAESQSQGDLALLQAELVHHHLTREINRQAVDPVLEANWGPAYRGKVRLEAAPLSDANQGFLRQLVTQVLADPKDFASGATGLPMLQGMVLAARNCRPVRERDLRGASEQGSHVVVMMLTSDARRGSLGRGLDFKDERETALASQWHPAPAASNRVLSIASATWTVSRSAACALGCHWLCQCWGRQHWRSQWHPAHS